MCAGGLLLAWVGEGLTVRLLQDLILFPGEATLLKVDQATWGRTYILKFSSSNQRHFVSHTSLTPFLHSHPK